LSYGNAPIKESQVDWLTATFKDGGKWQAAKIRLQGALSEEAEDGEDIRPFRFQGYSGEQAGRVGYGVRDDGALMRLSGSVSDALLGHLLPLTSNVSRIDLAVTADLTGIPVNPVVEGYKSGREAATHGGTRSDFQIIRHSRKGDTLYTGARTSQRFGRIYNKFSESQLAFYAGCYRWELEAKGKLATRLAIAVADSADRHGAIRTVVHDYYKRLGCTPPWDEHSPDLHISAYRPRTTRLSRLLWLARQVKPVIDKLIAEGHADDVYAALAVDPFRLPAPAVPIASRAIDFET
jgi:DNA relaxase NicK